MAAVLLRKYTTNDCFIQLFFQVNLIVTNHTSSGPVVIHSEVLIFKSELSDRNCIQHLETNHGTHGGLNT